MPALSSGLIRQMSLSIPTVYSFPILRLSQSSAAARSQPAPNRFIPLPSFFAVLRLRFPQTYAAIPPLPR
jgi:hypothetical protein